MKRLKAGIVNAVSFFKNIFGGNESAKVNTNHQTYIVFLMMCKGNKLFCDVSYDVDIMVNFLKRRADGSRAARFFSPQKVIYQKSYTTYEEAVDARNRIRELSRPEKEALQLSQSNPLS